MAIVDHQRGLAVGVCLSAAVVGAAVIATQEWSQSGGIDPSAPTQATATHIPLPTSGIGADESGEEAALEGTLQVSEQGCIYISRLFQFEGESPSYMPVLIVWPEDYTGVWSSDKVEIHDESGGVVARAGEFVTLGGGYHTPPNDHPCSEFAESAFWMPGSDT